MTLKWPHKTLRQKKSKKTKFEVIDRSECIKSMGNMLVKAECSSCHNKLHFIRETQNQNVKEYILSDIPLEIAEKVTKEIITTLDFASRVNLAKLYTDISHVVDVILLYLEEVEPYIHGCFIDKRSIFESNDPLKAHCYDVKRKSINMVFYELSKLIYHIDLVKEVGMYEMWAASWEGNIFVSASKQSLGTETNTLSFRYCVMSLFCLLCPSFPREPNIMGFENIETHYSTVSYSKDIFENTSLRDRINKLNMFKMANNHPKNEFGKNSNNESIEENNKEKACSHKPDSLLEEKTQKDILRNRFNSVEFTEYTSSKRMVLNAYSKDSGISIFSQDEEDLFLAIKPPLVRLTYYQHNQKKGSCVCCLGKDELNYHIIQGHLTDIILFLCNNRMQLEQKKEIRNAYESFLWCSPLAIKGEELINKLSKRCFHLFPYDYQNPSIQFKGTFYFLIDFLSINRDCLKSGTFKNLWTLSFLLISIGRVKWARMLRQIMSQLKFVTQNYYVYEIKEAIERDRNGISRLSQLYLNVEVNDVVGEILRIDPLSLCHQITIMNQELYHKITPNSFIMFSLEKTMPEHFPAKEFARSFDKIAKWIKSLINVSPKSEHRRIIEYFIKMSYHAIRVNNFHLANVVSALLQSNEFSGIMESKELSTQCTNLFSFADASHNYSNYRTLFSTLSCPFIPILFVHDNDIKRIHLRHSKTGLKEDKSSALKNLTLVKDVIGSDKHSEVDSINNFKSGLKGTQSSIASNDQNLWIQFEEFYEIRKYLIAQKLFDFKTHYQYNDSSSIIKIINDFTPLDNVPKFETLQVGSRSKRIRGLIHKLT